MYINFLRVTIPEDWGDLAIGSIGGMMDPDAAGFDLEDDSYKAAKVHTKHPTLLENSACISVRGRLKNVIQDVPRPGKGTVKPGSLHLRRSLPHWDFGRMHGLRALEGEDSEQGDKTNWVRKSIDKSGFKIV